MESELFLSFVEPLVFLLTGLVYQVQFSQFPSQNLFLVCSVRIVMFQFSVVQIKSYLFIWQSTKQHAIYFKWQLLRQNCRDLRAVFPMAKERFHHINCS